MGTYITFKWLLVQMFRIKVRIQLSQGHKSASAYFAHERQIVNMLRVYMVRQLVLRLEIIPAQVAGRLAAQFSAMSRVKNAIPERQSAMVALLVKLGMIAAAVKLLAMIISSTNRREPSIAFITFVRTQRVHANLVGLAFIVHVTLVQYQIVSPLKRRITLNAGERALTLMRAICPFHQMSAQVFPRLEHVPAILARVRYALLLDQSRVHLFLLIVFVAYMRAQVIRPLEAARTELAFKRAIAGMAHFHVILQRVRMAEHSIT